MECPYKQVILNPVSVFKSLFSDTRYQEMNNILKSTIITWKESLDSINFSPLNFYEIKENTIPYVRFPHTYGKGLDLSGCNLIEANFESSTLIDANFASAELINTNFKNAYLMNTKFSGSNLRKSNMNCAILIRANFNCTIMNNVRLDSSNLRYASFDGADLSNANLSVRYLILSQLINLAPRIGF